MLKLPIVCDCKHAFKIDPTGVTTDTDIVCPACQKIDHLDQDTIDRVEEDYFDAINEVFDDDDVLERLVNEYQAAPHKKRATVVDDGF